MFTFITLHFISRSFSIDISLLSLGFSFSLFYPIFQVSSPLRRQPIHSSASHTTSRTIPSNFFVVAITASLTFVDFCFENLVVQLKTNSCSGTSFFHTDPRFIGAMSAAPASSTGSPNPRRTKNAEENIKVGKEAASTANVSDVLTRLLHWAVSSCHHLAKEHSVVL